MGVPGLAWWARTNGFGKETKHEKTGRTRCNQKLVRKSELSARHCTPGLLQRLRMSRRGYKPLKNAVPNTVNFSCLEWGIS